MTPVEYLHEQLGKISFAFPNVQIKYGFNKLIHTHVVELLPATEFHNNMELDKTWIPLSFEFRMQFPDEDIVFVSSDSTLSLKETIFELNSQNESSVLSDLFEKLVDIEFDYTFPEYLPLPVTNIAIEASILGVMSCQIIEMVEVKEDADPDHFYQAAA